LVASGVAKLPALSVVMVRLALLQTM